MNKELKLGRMNRLKVTKKVEFGYYLEGFVRNERIEILLPNNEVDHTILQEDNMPEEVDVFIYLDQDERVIATMKEPLAQVGDFAYLEVAWVNNFGAFLHWGPMKDLFVPFREQKMKMQKGKSYIVHLHIDPESYRIMASAKIERYLNAEMPKYRYGQEVNILVWQKTDLGLKVIIENQFGGLLYENQIFRQIKTGDRLKAYVSQVRPDGKIDLSLQAPGMRSVEDFSEVLLRHLHTNAGETSLGDKSPAEEIYAVFGVSKKVFKKAVGDLYKRRFIEIMPEGLRLTSEGWDALPSEED
jgi:predicted RNA-binding protein (virulence factor B family)